MEKPTIILVTLRAQWAARWGNDETMSLDPAFLAQIAILASPPILGALIARIVRGPNFDLFAS